MKNTNKYKNRPRGSQPEEQLLAIRTNSPTVACQLTGDSPMEYLFRYETTYSLQLSHSKSLPFAMLKTIPHPNRPDFVEILSPNAHRHITNTTELKIPIIEITKNTAEVCAFCNLNNYKYYRDTGFVVTFDTHHLDGNRSNNVPSNLSRYCPNCHLATDSHSVNKNKSSFRPKWKTFLNYLDNNLSWDYISLKLKVSKSELQYNFYKIGLDLHYGMIIPPPRYIVHLFPNQNSTKFFRE